MYWLSGLTCTEDYFTTKAGAYGVAAELGLMVVAPDTSPREEGKPNDKAYDLGQGARFYLDAPNPSWSNYFHMYTCTTNELVHEIDGHFSSDPARRSVMGRLMGGHGALTISLKSPGLFVSASAIEPICALKRCPWGLKAFTAYLGSD